MRRGRASEGKLPTSSALWSGPGGLVAVRRVTGLLAVLSALAGAPVRAQPPQLPLNGSPYAPAPAASPTYPDPRPHLGLPCDLEPERDPLRGCYIRTGPVFHMGGGFIEERLNTGWMIQFGYREPLCWPRPALGLFAEVGLGYARNEGDKASVPIRGWFRGQDPPDDHVHFSIDGELVTSRSPGEEGDLMRTRLLRLERYDVHAALGGTVFPSLLNRRANNRTFLTGRAGLRTGFIEPEYSIRLLPEIREGVREHLGHGHQRIEFSTNGGDDPRLFFGMYASAGFGMTFTNARLLGLSLGTVTITLEAEFTHDWFDLGIFDKGDHGLATFTPMGTLGFSF